MAKDLENLSSNIIARGGKNTPLALGAKAKEWFLHNKSIIAEQVGGPAEARRLYTAVMDTVTRNPLLLEATPQSIFTAFMQCAALRLYPGPLQECAIVPFNNKKTGKMEAQFMPQYQGLIKLAYQGGFVKKVSCRVVWSNEEFEHSFGSDEYIKHVPIFDERERGERVGVYSIIKTCYNEEIITYLPASFLARTQSRSAAGKSYSSPWNSQNPDDVDWMWKKTALRQGLKLLPKSAELARALQADDAVDAPDSVKNPILDFSLGAETESGDVTSDTIENAET